MIPSLSSSTSMSMAMISAPKLSDPPLRRLLTSFRNLRIDCVSCCAERRSDALDVERWARLAYSLAASKRF